MGEIGGFRGAWDDFEARSYGEDKFVIEASDGVSAGRGMLKALGGWVESASTDWNFDPDGL
jgi:hypothetical protein